MPSKILPLREAVVSLLSYGAIALWWLWPLPLVVTDHAVQVPNQSVHAPADFDLITWALSWGTHSLLTDPLGIWNANAFHPAGLSLAFSEHFFGYLPLFAPTWLATGNPVLASNVVLWLTYPLTGLGAYALARRFLPASGAWLAGFFFAFCGLRYFTLWHFHLLGVFGLPLALLFTERWLDEAKTPDAVLLALSLGFQALTSFYLAYAMALLYGAYLVFAAWRWRDSLDTRRIVGLGVVGFVVAAMLVGTSLPYLSLREEGWLPSYQADTARTLQPGVTAYRIGEYLRLRSVGWAGFALALLALVPPWRDARGLRSIAVVAVLVGLLFAAGPVVAIGDVKIPSPYRILMEVVPGFDAVRLPRRFLVCTQLGLALLAGIGLTRVFARISFAWAAPLGAIAVALLSLVTFTLPSLVAHAKPSPSSIPEAYRYLAREGAERPLLELPMGSSREAARRMVYSTFHWLPTIDGYSAYPPPTRGFFSRIARGLPYDESMTRLLDHIDLGWILVHTEQLSSAGRARWLAHTPAGLELVATWDHERLYQVVATGRALPLDRLFSRSVTPAGTPITPVGADCAGGIEAFKPPPVVVSPGARIDFVVGVHNRTSSTWPAFAVFADGLVRVDAIVRRNGRKVGTAQSFLLDGDVPGGRMVLLRVDLTMPRRPGTYTLELAGWQDDVALESCGLPPLNLDVTVAPPGAIPPQAGTPHVLRHVG